MPRARDSLLKSPILTALLKISTTCGGCQQKNSISGGPHAVDRPLSGGWWLRIGPVEGVLRGQHNRKPRARKSPQRGKKNTRPHRIQWGRCFFNISFRLLTTAGKKPASTQGTCHQDDGVALAAKRVMAVPFGHRRPAKSEGKKKKTRCRSASIAAAPRILGDKSNLWFIN